MGWQMLVLCVGAALVAGILLVVFAAWVTMIRMPGRSYAGPLAPLTQSEEALRDALRRDVQTLAGNIGERNVRRYAQLVEAAAFLKTSLEEAGYEVLSQPIEVDGRVCENLEVEIRGAERPDEICVIGGHYDSAPWCPAANDNATGAAAVVALASAFAGRRLRRTVRFVCFVNEEPPYYRTAAMGSVVYANRCKERGEDIVAMFSLETMGYYLDEPGSQQYPPPLGLLYPTTGNFIAFVGNVSSRKLVRQAVGSFRRHARGEERRLTVLDYLRRVRRYRSDLLRDRVQHAYRDGAGEVFGVAPPFQGRMFEADFMVSSLEGDEQIDGTRYVEELMRRAAAGNRAELIATASADMG